MDHLDPKVSALKNLCIVCEEDAGEEPLTVSYPTEMAGGLICRDCYELEEYVVAE